MFGILFIIMNHMTIIATIHLLDLSMPVGNSIFFLSFFNSSARNKKTQHFRELLSRTKSFLKSAVNITKIWNITMEGHMIFGIHHVYKLWANTHLYTHLFQKLQSHLKLTIDFFFIKELLQILKVKGFEKIVTFGQQNNAKYD